MDNITAFRAVPPALPSPLPHGSTPETVRHWADRAALALDGAVPLMADLRKRLLEEAARLPVGMDEEEAADLLHERVVLPEMRGSTVLGMAFDASLLGFQTAVELMAYGQHGWGDVDERLKQLLVRSDELQEEVRVIAERMYDQHQRSRHLRSV